MAVPIRPDPPAKFVPGRSGLSKEWQSYFAKPFVADTLSRLVNDPVEVSSFDSPPQDLPNLRAGTTNAGTIQLYGKQDEEALGAFTHEVGHVIDRRSQETGDALEITETLRAIFNTAKPPAFTYESDTGNLPEEYVAETFRSAMEIVRSPAEQQQRDLQLAERSFPGITLWYNWIQQRLNGNKTAAK